jgi:predicted cupin superfamily sugar epimerase
MIGCPPVDLRDAGQPSAAVIRALGLQPHPEGGHFRETWRDAPADGGRGVGTAILFLLAVGEVSAWHRVDADELWVWQAGAPLVISISPDGHDAAAHRLGPDMTAHEQLQLLVGRGQWQTATSLGNWTLVSCIVAPAFRFEGFELAAPDWRPRPRAAAGG